MVPRSITTGRTGAAVVRSEARSTARTPTAVAVRSSTTDIIPAVEAGKVIVFIVGPLSGAAADTFMTAFLGRIPAAAGLLCTTTGGADVAMGRYTARAAAAGNIAAVNTSTITPLRFVVIIVVVSIEVQRLPRLMWMSPINPFLPKIPTFQRLLLLMRINPQIRINPQMRTNPQMKINPEQLATECCTFA